MMGSTNFGKVGLNSADFICLVSDVMLFLLRPKKEREKKRKRNLNTVLMTVNSVVGSQWIAKA